MVLTARAFSRASPIVTLQVTLNSGNCHLTMHVKGRCARGVQPHTLIISMVKHNLLQQNIFTRNLRNKSVVAFDTNDWLNPP